MQRYELLIPVWIMIFGMLYEIKWLCWCHGNTRLSAPIIWLMEPWQRILMTQIALCHINPDTIMKPSRVQVFILSLYWESLHWYNGMSVLNKGPGPRLKIKTVFPGMGIPMLKIRRSRDIIFNMGIPILVRQHLYIETVPWLLFCWRITLIIGGGV